MDNKAEAEGSEKVKETGITELEWNKLNIKKRIIRRIIRSIEIGLARKNAWFFTEMSGCIKGRQLA